MTDPWELLEEARKRIFLPVSVMQDPDDPTGYRSMPNPEYARVLELRRVIDAALASHAAEPERKCGTCLFYDGLRCFNPGLNASRTKQFLPDPEWFCGNWQPKILRVTELNPTGLKDCSTAIHMATAVFPNHVAINKFCAEPKERK